MIINSDLPNTKGVSRHLQDSGLSEIHDELPQKLRLLSFAADNGDFHEVAFIAHHLNELMERFGLFANGHSVNRLEKISAMNSSDVKREVNNFTNYWLGVVNGGN